MNLPARESAPVDTPELRIFPNPAASESTVEEQTEVAEKGVLTKVMLDTIQRLRESGELRELVDPGKREMFDQWESSGEY